MIFDPLYLLFAAPGVLLSLWASYRTKSAFNKYSRVGAASGMTGAQAAHRLLAYAGITDVEIVATRGMLSDHYNPMSKKLALSEPVYGSSSLAAIGVACHEAGHAIQHARGYAPLKMRSALVPVAGIGSQAGLWIAILGAFFSTWVSLVGVALFGLFVLFQLITLPVEFDATARAKKLALEQGLVMQQEQAGMSKVLDAAALTYVAAAASAIMTLLYLLLRAGLLGGNRN